MKKKYKNKQMSKPEFTEYGVELMQKIFNSTEGINFDISTQTLVEGIDVIVVTDKTEVVKITDEIFQTPFDVINENCIPVGDFYKDYISLGKNPKKTFTILAKNIIKNKAQKDLIASSLTNPDKLKELPIALLVLEESENREYLETVVSKPIGATGLSLCCFVMINGQPIAGIDNNMLRCMGLSEEELFVKAFKEGWEKDEPILCNFGKYKKNHLKAKRKPIKRTGIGLYSLCNKRQTENGGYVLFLPNMQRMIAEVFGESFYALLMGTFECAIIPQSELKAVGMVQDDLFEFVDSLNADIRENIKEVKSEFCQYSKVILKYDKNIDKIYRISKGDMPSNVMA